MFKSFVGSLPIGKDKSLPCPYCISPSMMKATKYNDKASPQYQCALCESIFEIDSNGDLEAVVPTNPIEFSESFSEMDSSILGNGRSGINCLNTPTKGKLSSIQMSPRYCTPLKMPNKTPLRWEDPSGLGLPLLCRRCQTNQTIITNLLSSCDDIDHKFTLYRNDLENRYPLCMECKEKVEKRLLELNGVLRSQRNLTFNKDKNTKRSTFQQKIPLFSFMCDLFLTLITLISIERIENNAKYYFSLLIFAPLNLFFLLYNRNLASIPLFLLRIFYLFKGNDSIYIISGIFASHYILYDSFVSFPLKQQNESFKEPSSLMQMKQSIKEPVKVMKYNTTSDPDSPLRSLSGLDSLGPQTPLTTRYADLKKRKGAFSQMKPSSLTFNDKTSGLEDVLNNFSLNCVGTSPTSTSATTSATTTRKNSLKRRNFLLNNNFSLLEWIIRIFTTIILVVARISLPLWIVNGINDKVIVSSLLLVPFLLFERTKMIMKIITISRIIVLLSDRFKNDQHSLLWSLWDSLNIMANSIF